MIKYLLCDALRDECHYSPNVFLLHSKPKHDFLQIIHGDLISWHELRGGGRGGGGGCGCGGGRGGSS